MSNNGLEATRGRDRDSATTITIRKQIEQLVQLNKGQAYTYDRMALVKMLDEALAKARPQTH